MNMATNMTTTQPDAWTGARILGFRSPTTSIWASFCDQCRVTSMDASISRPLHNAIAWDVAGPVLAYWNETLFPMITEYRNKNSREILQGRPWDGSVDCWMVGTRATEAVPHIIINCHHEKIAKRYEKFIKNDPIIKGSGFRICRKRGNIRYRTSIPGAYPSPPQSPRQGHSLADPKAPAPYPPPQPEPDQHDSDHQPSPIDQSSQYLVRSRDFCTPYCPQNSVLTFPIF